MRSLVVALALALAACNPAQTPNTGNGEESNAGGAGQAQAPDPERDAMVAALTPLASEDIGIPVALEVSAKRTEGDWGWIVAQPWTPEGAQIDWSTTRHASRAENGVMDGAGTTYALLRRQDGQWTVVAFTVGPTDVAWADWPQRYGAPASLMQ